jgi:hypothetical protein|tara:strand:- start:306 stop:482 length:177 start_codon:yes stop_codon:yes gene_type:complete
MAAVLAKISDHDIAPLPANSDGGSEDIGGLTVIHRFAEAPDDGETLRGHFVEAGAGEH